MSDRRMVVLISVCIATVLIAIVAAVTITIVVDYKQNQEIATACVNSGGEWVLDFGAYYKCIRP